MSAVRTLAFGVLRIVLRNSPPGVKVWVEAMTRELDFVESDWAALFWALGSTTAVFKQSTAEFWRWPGSRHEGRRTNHARNRLVGVASGGIVAVMLVFCAFGLLRLSEHLFPALGLDRLEWAHWLTVIVIPEAIFVVATIKLWRKKGAFAVGILLSAVVLAVHFAIHVASQ